ncbi:MAG TPA: hypothetical protein VMP03_09545 [Methylomirabilota bacterium]|nr:hypothetical protein [Methylomirabilota bacterium]
MPSQADHPRRNLDWLFDQDLVVAAVPSSSEPLAVEPAAEITTPSDATEPAAEIATPSDATEPATEPTKRRKALARPPYRGRAPAKRAASSTRSAKRSKPNKVSPPATTSAVETSSPTSAVPEQSPAIAPRVASPVAPRIRFIDVTPSGPPSVSVAPPPARPRPGRRYASAAVAIVLLGFVALAVSAVNRDRREVAGNDPGDRAALPQMATEVGLPQPAPPPLKTETADTAPRVVYDSWPTNPGRASTPSATANVADDTSIPAPASTDADADAPAVADATPPPPPTPRSRPQDAPSVLVPDTAAAADPVVDAEADFLSSSVDETGSVGDGPSTPAPGPTFAPGHEPRIVVHAPRSALAEIAGPLTRALDTMTDDVEMVGVDLALRASRVRYFYPEDRTAAQSVRRAVAATEGDWNVELSDFTHYRPLPRPGTVEVWIRTER